MPSSPSTVRSLRPFAPLPVRKENLLSTLKDLLSIPSPAGYTDAVVHYLAERFAARGVDYELTRRGAMRVNLAGRETSPDRAVVAHVDTLGAQDADSKQAELDAVFALMTLELANLFERLDQWFAIPRPGERD